MRRRGEAGDMVFALSFLLILSIIGIGVVAEIYLFFGGEYEFRGIDAELIGNRAAKCISDFGTSDNTDSFLKNCGIDREIMEENNLYLKICENDNNCLSSLSSKVQVGGNFQSCAFEGAKGNSNFPVCTEIKLKSGGNEYSVIAGSNQHISYRRIG